MSNSYGGDEFNGVIAVGSRYYSHAGVAMVAPSADAGFTTAVSPPHEARSSPPESRQ